MMSGKSLTCPQLHSPPCYLSPPQAVVLTPPPHTEPPGSRLVLCPELPTCLSVPATLQLEARVSILPATRTLAASPPRPHTTHCWLNLLLFTQIFFGTRSSQSGSSKQKFSPANRLILKQSSRHGGPEPIRYAQDLDFPSSVLYGAREEELEGESIKNFMGLD